MIGLNNGDIVYYFREEIVNGKVKARVCTGEVVATNPLSGRIGVSELGTISRTLKSFSTEDLNRYFFMNIRDMFYRLP